MQLRRTLIAVLALLGALAMPVAARAESGITPVGTLERVPPEALDAFGAWVATDDFEVGPIKGTLVPVPEAGQLWQVFPSSALEPPLRTGILVRDARTLRVRHTMLLPTRLERATINPWGGEWLHATGGGSVFLVEAASRTLLAIDTATFAVRRLGVLTVSPVELPGGLRGLDALLPAGLTYDEHTGDLLVLYGGPPASSVAGRLVVLQRIDLVDGTRQSRLVRSCDAPLPQNDAGGETYGAELLLRADAVYVTCHRTTGTSPFLGSLPEPIVVRLPRATLWDSTGPESSVAAGRYFDAALVDSGGGRIAVVDIQSRVTVVDVAAMTVVGSFDASTLASPSVGAGLDRSTGRFFFQSNAGLGFVDLRATPLQSPTIATSYAAAGQERIVAQGNRILVLSGQSQQRPDHYVVYNVAP